MAFEGLGEKLQETFKKLRGKGKLGEKDIKEAMREVKLALLEADVNFKVVKKFVKNVSEKCVGSEVLESLTPAQQVIKIVNDELTTLMGGSKSEIDFSGVGPTVIMMAGLQGAGKTTMSGKLALQLRKNHNKRPLLVACDIYRPAAIKQLEIVGKQIDVPVFQMGDKVSPVEIAKEGIKYARENSLNVVIIDTAGRLHIDEELMTELKDVKVAVDPNEILLVVDSMTGQDAVNVAETFNEALDISGVVLTKLDGDTRGGAALSIREIIQKPIKFIGVGEKMNDFSKDLKFNEKYNPIIIVLNREREHLYERINKRVDIMMDNGLINEVKNLLKMGYTKDMISMQGIGYKEIIKYLDGEYTLDEAIDIIKRDSRRYAKRQLTWFRRYNDAKWFNLDEYSDSQVLKNDIIMHIEKML